MQTLRGTIVTFDSGTFTATVRLDGSAAQTLTGVAVNRGLASAAVTAGRRCIIDTATQANPALFVVVAVFG
jgi:hypothetical protein